VDAYKILDIPERMNVVVFKQYFVAGKDGLSSGLCQIGERGNNAIFLIVSGPSLAESNSIVR
jgi:hypothetical protein